MRRATTPLSAVLVGALMVGVAWRDSAGSGLGAGLVVVVALLVAAVSIGWPPLLSLPSPKGSGGVVTLVGLAAVVAVATSISSGTHHQHSILSVAGVLAFGVLAAFGHQLLRRDMRPRVVDGLSGVLAGMLTVVCATGWIAAPSLPGGHWVVVVVAGSAAVTVAVAVGTPGLLRAGPWRWVTVVALGGLAGALLAAASGRGAPGSVTGSLLGLAAGVVVALVAGVLAPLPTTSRILPAVSVALAPVAASGLLAFVAASLLS